MDWTRLIFALSVSGMGVYALVIGKVEIATACLGIMGAILTPHVKETKNEKVDPAPPAAPAP